MRYAGFIDNDFVNGVGVCVSFWAQGCPYHCEGCHNPQTWDFNGGIEKDENELLDEIIEAIPQNGVKRNLSVLGGEPMCRENIEFVSKLLLTAKEKYGYIKTFVWTGMNIEDIISKSSANKFYETAIKNIDILVDGKFILEKRDISSGWKGSTNQRVIDVKETLRTGIVTLWKE